MLSPGGKQITTCHFTTMSHPKPRGLVKTDHPKCGAKNKATLFSSNMQIEKMSHIEQMLTSNADMVIAATSREENEVHDEKTLPSPIRIYLRRM
jgi:hypothetical protein